MESKQVFRVAALLPFWRWAVVPANSDIDPHMPGMPYYRESTARDFFEEVMRDCPGFPVFLVKRHFGLRGSELEVIEESK